MSGGIGGGSAGGATVTGQRVTLSADFTTTSTSFVNVTGMTFTADNNAGSSLAVFCFNTNQSAGSAGTFLFRIVDGVTNGSPKGGEGRLKLQTVPRFVANDNQVVTLQTKSDGSGTVTIYGTGDYISEIEVLEIV